MKRKTLCALITGLGAAFGGAAYAQISGGVDCLAYWTVKGLRMTAVNSMTAKKARFDNGDIHRSSHSSLIVYDITRATANHTVVPASRAMSS